MKILYVSLLLGILIPATASASLLQPTNQSNASRTHHQSSVEVSIDPIPGFIITPVEISTDRTVIRADDESGKMTTIYGGESGQRVLDSLNDLRVTSPVAADLLTTLLLNRWRTLNN